MRLITSKGEHIFKLVYDRKSVSADYLYDVAQKLSEVLDNDILIVMPSDVDLSEISRSELIQLRDTISHVLDTYNKEEQVEF